MDANGTAYGKLLRAGGHGNEPYVSKHVGVLAQAGIVGREKEGTHVRCLIADESVFELCEIVCGGLRAQVAELDQLLSGGAA